MRRIGGGAFEETDVFAPEVRSPPDQVPRVVSPWGGVGTIRRLRRLGSREGLDEPIPEGRAERQVLRRDSLYRRLLAGADVVAAGVALLLAVSVLGDDRLTWPVLVALPLVILVSKVIRLYDRDEYRLHKTTLDEAPALFQVATLYALRSDH